MMRRRPLLFLIAALAGLGVAPAAAHAEFGIAPGGLTATMIDSGGNPEVRAGSHPDRFQMNMSFNVLEGGAPDENLRDMVLELPAGFVGDPTATPTCSREVVTITNTATCPADTQIGVINVGGFNFGIHNTDPAPGGLADFAFEAFFDTIHLTARLGADGRTLSIEMNDAIQDLAMTGMSVELWGVPADRQTGTTIPRRALLTAPTRCDIPPTLTARMRSWQAGAWKESSVAMAPLVGCESLPFEPRLEFGLDRATTDTPTGAELNMIVPQGHDDPSGQVGDRIDEVAVELPEGMALSASGANGLAACPEAAVGVGEPGEARCPASSRVGSIELATPLLADPIVGKVYMGPQLPGTDFRLFVVATGPGINLKIPLALHADPDTGRLSTRLVGLPPMPFERLTLRFAGGSRAPLVTSMSCGPAVASATFTPYGGGPPVVSADSVAIAAAPGGQPCPSALPFAPDFVAGTTLARAGVASPFAATIRHRDGEQPLDSFSVALPPGLSARLGAVQQCSAPDAAAARCPAGSRIGTVAVEAGSGPNPMPLRGDVFLTGPYRLTKPYRATPFGLVLVFHAVAGPFDLGTLAVRAAMRLDQYTGRVTIDTDAMPQILRGIPLRMQTIALDIDRPGFIVNPTSCSPSRIESTVKSAAGTSVSRGSRFAVAGCSKLRFRPRLSLALTGRSELRAGGRPGMRLRMTAPPDGANVRELSVDLPKLLGASPIGPTAICSLVQARDGRCPSAAKIGAVAARTPLLAKPLRGSVYIVQPRGNGLPDVWATMRGAGVSVTFRMKITVSDDGQVHGRLVDLPDMPLSGFTMTFAGGEHGMFSATRSPCAGGRARRMVTTVRMTAHSNAKRRLATRAGVARGC